MEKLTKAQSKGRLISSAVAAIMISAGVVTPTKPLSYKANKLVSYPPYKEAAEKIMDVILQRKYENVDKEFKTICYSVRDNLSNLFDSNAKRYSVAPADVASGLGYICAKSDINWDNSENSTVSKQEIEEFKNNTLLGQAVDLYDCWAVKNNPVQPQKVRKASVSTSGSATQRVPGQPQNDYKSRGPQSANAFDLKSQPGQKITLGKPVFRILVAGGKRFFVRPLDAAGHPGGISTNKVFVGSAHGYTDCELIFSNPQDADTALYNLKSSDDPKVRNAAMDPNTAVVKLSPVKNGYFRIGTELGDAYISAAKLNEELPESLEAPVEKPARKKVNRSYRKHAREALKIFKDCGINFNENFGLDTEIKENEGEN